MRELFDSASDGDRKFIEKSFAQYRTTLGFPDAPTDTSPEESAMAVNFIIDPRALPREFRVNLDPFENPDGTTRLLKDDAEARAYYVKGVADYLKSTLEIDPVSVTGAARFGFIIGCLLNREFFVPKAAGVQTAIMEAYQACL